MAPIGKFNSRDRPALLNHFTFERMPVMTEKEKMLSGSPYNSRDPELLAMYHKARRLFQEYNRLESTESERREELLRQLFKFKGERVWIEPPFYCDYGENISIGEGTFVNANCFFLDNNTITIGKNGLIAPYVQIYTAKHPVNANERIIFDATGKSGYLTKTCPVTIGDNVWIGGNAIIMPGVSIGDNVTIGAGSVVTKDIESNILALGNPCKAIKKI